MECKQCSAERHRRNRLLAEADERVRQEPFRRAPFVHKNNEPKYLTMYQRARELARQEQKHALWFTAVDKPVKPSQITKDPTKLKERMRRFLQFHDQQTKGIPGLNVIFVGLRARVTEHLVKNKSIRILKHSSCTVIGWDLHPADRRSEAGHERFLDYMPNIIYLKFEKAEWVVHKKLGPGVWPLLSVTRTWVLNKDSGVNIQRQGFPLVPDFASTAFMIQGETLEACIADCGDVLDRVGLSELMTTYVILSRVKRAGCFAFAACIQPLAVPTGKHTWAFDSDQMAATPRERTSRQRSKHNIHTLRCHSGV